MIHCTQIEKKGYMDIYTWAGPALGPSFHFHFVVLHLHSSIIIDCDHGKIRIAKSQDLNYFSCDNLRKL